MKITIEPIGYVYSERKEAVDDNWKEVKSWIELNNNFSEESLDGLHEFSHLEVIYHFHKVNPSEIVSKSEHPRENPNWPKVGIFSQRKKARPNLLGTTICEILKVEGKRIYVQGLDAIDQTPVIDIKPVFKEYLPNDISKVKQPNWVTELMKNYW
ncbi:MAG: SAM-dependent methyltransferase [Ignavibacteriales bacterium]|nr:SAM-dependent methyltransferase [Ignavibacteriales bacterium]